jgi:Carboxypeptidase regulatory-like domain
MYWGVKTKCLRLCYFLLGFCLTLSPLARPQTNSATINGTVSDQTGSAIPGATVTATEIKTAIQKTATTDQDGRYTILNLTPGAYNIQATKQGFSTLVRGNQTLLVGTTVTLDFPLMVSPVNQTVEVTTATPLIEVTQNVLDRVIQTQELDSLPIINRSFGSLAALSPGVYVNNGTIQFGDSMTASTAYIVDGNSIAKENNGGQIVTMAQDWIQEFSVVTEQASPEYGGSYSGFVNAVTRSGGNEIHGRAYGYFQDAAMNAKPSFLPKSAPNKPPFDQQRLGGMIGGPIIKEKLFYFLGYEWLNNLTSVPINLTGNFASLAGAFPQTTVNHLAMAKVDYNVNSANILHVRANETYNINNNSGIGSSGSTTKSLSDGIGVRGDGQVFQATWDRVLSSTLLNEVRAEYTSNYISQPCNAYDLFGPYTGGGANATPFGNPTGFYASVTYSVPGVVTGCPAIFGNQGERNWLFADSLGISHGTHDLKIGVSAGRRNLVNRHINKGAEGAFTIATGSAPFDPDTAQLVGNANASGYPTAYSIAWEPGNGLTDDEVQPYFALFVQDSWKLKSTLTLNMGMRYDYDFGNGLIKTLPDLNKINNDPTMLAPRVGFAWSPFHDHNKTVIRGGFGIFYDMTHGNFGATYFLVNTGPEVSLNLNYNNASLNPYCTQGVVSCAGGVPGAYQQAVQEVLAYALANSTLPDFNPPGGTITIGPNVYTIPSLPSLPPTAIFNVEKNTRHPGTAQTTIGLARQIGSNLGVSADFAYNHGYNEYIIANANINPDTFQPIFPNYGSIGTYTNAGYSNVYSLLVQSHYRTKRGDSFQLAYTYQKGWNNSPAGIFNLTTGQTQAENPFDFDLDYGPSTEPHNIVNASGSIKAIWGIRIAPIVSFRTGIPYTATQTAHACPSYFTFCYPDGYSKNSLLGTDSFSLDGRISKVFKFGERYAATLMFESYNLSNHVNFTSFQGNVTSPAFRQPIGANARRQLQAGFQFDF